jgi:predicted MFS family arabinose efflux permease
VVTKTISATIPASAVGAAPTMATQKRSLRVRALLAVPGLLQISFGNAFIHLGLRLPSVAVAWLVLELTGSNAWLGVVNGAPAFAVILFSLLGGVLADSRDARRVLIGARTTLAAVWFVAAVLVTTDQVEMHYLVLVVLVSVSATAVDMPIGRNLLFEAVGRERLLSATSMSAMVMNFLNIGAPAGLGYLIGSVGVDAALYTLAAGYLVSLALVASTRISRREAAPVPSRPLADLAAGFAYLRSESRLAWLVSLAFLVPIAGVFFAMVPIYAREVLDVGPGGLGLMLAVYGIGSLTGSSYLTLRGSVRRRGLLIAVLGIAFGVGMVLFALSESFALSCAVGYGMGVTAMLWQNTLSTVAQSTASPALRGRVMSIYTMGLQLVSLGWLIGGGASAVIGVQPTLVAAGLAFCGFSFFVFLESKEVREID